MSDFWQQQECELREMWECVYCGKPVPSGIQQEMNLCCGEVGHVGRVEEQLGSEMADAENVAGKD